MKQPSVGSLKTRFTKIVAAYVPSFKHKLVGTLLVFKAPKINDEVCLECFNVPKMMTQQFQIIHSQLLGAV